MVRPAVGGRSLTIRERGLKLAQVTLQHVSLEVPADRLADCVAFWQLLGFEPVQLPEQFSGQVAWVHRGGTSIHLIVTEKPIVPATGHAAVVLDPYEAGLDRLRTAGFEPEARTEYWGAARAYVRDPAGHTVEVMAAPPPI
jgi:catechol 2,3-dioxygenase-like lactoylglutathione lyase family enzyme